MKVLVLVNSVSQIPKKHYDRCVIVTQHNWEETYNYLRGKTNDSYLFLHETTPTERLLKLVEDYRGNLAVYTSVLVDSIFLSRFSKVINRREVTLNKHFGEPSANEALLKTLKGVLV